MAGVLSGCQIVLDLSTSVGFKKKQEVRSTITQNGGVISYIVTKKSTHVVLNDAEKADVGYKCKMAAKFCIPVVSLDFIFDCISQGKLLDTDNYLLVGKTKAQEFSSGKISAEKSELKPKGKNRKTVFTFNPKSVKAWKEKDKNMPAFDEESEVAKFAMFQKCDKKTHTTQFGVLEICAFRGVTALENKDATPRFCVCSHRGSVEDLQNKADSESKEFRFVQTSEEALSVYSALYKQMKDRPSGMNVCHKPPCQNIGTNQFQKLILEYGMEETELSSPVAELMQHIWREAGGEIEEVLSSPLPSIKLDQVEKATAILTQMKESQSDNSKLQALFEEFYTALPHRPQYRTTSFSMSWLARKLDLCQLIKDMVSVSEATNWSTQSNAEAQYKALRCQISHVSGGLPRQILDILNLKQGEEMRIQNVYAIHRPSESENFRSDLSSRPLFHASNAENFVGILSRGLLMPKVVVDDYGGKRTDPGMLGHGIYFANSASTSMKYSKPSKTRNTRMMLVSQVALGTTLDVYKHQWDLTAPPSGYHSVHGVAATEGVESDFQDDEFVVYNTDQQMLSYLVEFTIGSEIPVEISVEKEVLEREETPEETIIDISDVHDVTNPLTKVKAGLVSNDNTPVTLLEAHIRAKLIDLAGEVVVLQEYHNNSDQALEAKYVFPLDEMAAVCGFEAFINGKHIVGEVKEKETAHREYKRAVQEGHGAYLMDQDEETPEVFTVSVGNLPTGAVVVIKITYVTELQVDGDLINFRLPGSVAPWKQKFVEAPEFKDKSWDTVQVEDTCCSVQVYVDMPFDIRSLECPTHKVLSKRTATKAVVQMKDNLTLEDGFQLLIGLAEIHVPRMWVESDEGGSQQEDESKFIVHKTAAFFGGKADCVACMLTFYPEFEADEESEVEVILMIDSSNSMKDSSHRDAKKAALLVLHLMDPTWRFNVVSFGTAFRELFPSSQPANKFNVQTARQHIQKLQANQGNTELCRPLHSYYLLKSESSTRNIFLFSDGHINNDEETLVKISQNSQHTRVFTMGISSVANRHLLKAIARVGAGSFEFYDSKFKSKWEDKVRSQLQKAAQPVLTSVSVDWRHDDQHPAPIQAPQQITALFSGSRQVVYGFVDNCYMATLKAKIGGQEISTVVSTSDLSVTKGKMLHRLTAKGVIRDWEDGVLSPDRTGHEVKKMNLKQYVIELSKRYSIVTSLTSFVAIEKREKDEVVSDSAPVIKDLLTKEDVDVLTYLSWDNEDEAVPDSSPAMGGVDMLYNNFYASSDNEELEELKSTNSEERFLREERGTSSSEEEEEEEEILEENGKKGKSRKFLARMRSCRIPVQATVPMASEVSFQASPDKIIADFNVYEDLDKQDVMHEEQDPSAQAKYRIKMGGLGYKGDIVSRGQKDTCVESEVTGSKPRVGKVIDESTGSPTFYGSAKGFKESTLKIMRKRPLSGRFLRRRSSAVPSTCTLPPTLDPKPPPTLDPTPTPTLDSMPQPPILAPKPIPPALEVEPNFYNSLSNRSLTGVSKQARIPALPSMEASRSSDELQPRLKSTQPVSWRSCPLPLRRPSKKRVLSPPSDPFVSIYDESEPLLGEENDMNADITLQGKLLPSEEGEKSTRGPVIQEGDLGTDSDSDLPPPPPPQPDIDYMGALAKKLAMRKKPTPVIQEGDLGADSDSDLPPPPPPPPLPRAPHISPPHTPPPPQQQQLVPTPQQQGPPTQQQGPPQQQAPPSSICSVAPTPTHNAQSSSPQREKISGNSISNKEIHDIFVSWGILSANPLRRIKSQSATPVHRRTPSSGSVNSPFIRKFSGGYRTGKLEPSNTVFQRISDEKVLSTDETDGLTLCLIDTTPLALGVEDVAGNFIVIIPQNTSIPCRKNQAFTCTDADQTMADIHVYEGCYKEAKKNNFLGHLQIENLGASSPGRSWVTVTMEVDENNVLTVAVKDNQSGTELISVTIDKEKRNLSKEQVENMAESADIEDYKSLIMTSGMRSKLPSLPSGRTEKTLDDMNNYGIGTSVSNIRKRSPNLSLSSLRSVFSIQQLDESLEEVFGIDSKKCKDILQKAGLSSLGKQVTSEVFDILSSAIALLLIYKTIVPELFPLDFSNPNTMETAYTMVKERLEGISSENASLVESLRSSVAVYTAKRQKYDWVCSMLELGHSWEVVASKMLGYTSS